MADEKVEVKAEEWYRKVIATESTFQNAYENNQQAIHECWNTLQQLRKQEKHICQVLDFAKDLHESYSELKKNSPPSPSQKNGLELSNV